MKTFCIAGRYGDIIIALSAFKYLSEKSGQKVPVITSSKFGDIFDGVSYVQRIAMPNQTGEEDDFMKEYIRSHPAKILRWWMAGDKPEEDWKDIPTGKDEVCFRGKKWILNFQKWPNYQTSLFDRTGVPIEMMNTLPLVFDRRDKKRESELVKEATKKNKKNLPLLLYNFSGHSSPFAAMPEVMNRLDKYRGQFFFIDLANYQCHRIYDLLGLMDVAKLLITIDTSTLHLAAASPVRQICYLNQGWSSSVPKGNVLCTIRYKNAVKNLDKLEFFVQSSLNT